MMSFIRNNIVKRLGRFWAILMHACIYVVQGLFVVAIISIAYVAFFSPPEMINASDGKSYEKSTDSQSGYLCIDSTLYVVRSKMMSPVVKSHDGIFTYLTCAAAPKN